MGAHQDSLRLAHLLSRQLIGCHYAYPDPLWHRVRSDDRLLPGRETSLAAFRQRILKDDSRFGAHSGQSHFSKPAIEQNPDFATWMLRTGHWRPQPTGQEQTFAQVLQTGHSLSFDLNLMRAHYKALRLVSCGPCG